MDVVGYAFDESKAGGQTEKERKHLTEVTDRVERQAALLLTALHAIYSALAAFASSTLVTLLGAGLAALPSNHWVHTLALLGLVLGFFGAGGLVVGCVSLFRATQLSLVNICDEAALPRPMLLLFRVLILPFRPEVMKHD